MDRLLTLAVKGHEEEAVCEANQRNPNGLFASREVRRTEGTRSIYDIRLGLSIDSLLLLI